MNDSKQSLIGKVKWFSQEKGYGFITNDKHTDYYFSGTDIDGAELPQNGATVIFFVTENKKGLRATNVAITMQSIAAIFYLRRVSHFCAHLALK